MDERGGYGTRDVPGLHEALATIAAAARAAYADGSNLRVRSSGICQGPQDQEFEG